MVRKLSAPLFAQLELTEGCNHGCGYCSNPFSHRRLKRPSIKETETALGELLKNRVFSVVLTGGEPFTNREVLHYAIDRLNREPIEVYVNTNLSQPIKQEDINKLRTVDYVLVSFPSYNEERFNKIVGANSFQKVVANLERVVSEGIHVGINQVVTPLNYADVGETVDFLVEKIGLREFSASPVIPSCSGTSADYSINSTQILELAKQLIDIEKKTGVRTDMLTFIPPCFFPETMIEHRLAAHGCSASRDSAIISATGDVRKCALLSKSYGNIHNEDLKTIWGRILEAQKPSNIHCSSCMPYEYCANGCEARAVACGGEDPFVIGLPEKRRKSLYKTLEDSTVLVVDRVMFRPEGEEYLIGHGGSYVMGNEYLLKLLERIKGKRFSFFDAKRDWGEPGAKLVNYLFNRGILKICNSN